MILSNFIRLIIISSHRIVSRAISSIYIPLYRDSSLFNSSQSSSLSTLLVVTQQVGATDSSCQGLSPFCRSLRLCGGVCEKLLPFLPDSLRVCGVCEKLSYY